MIPLRNKYVERIDDSVGDDEYFCADYVKQVVTASRSLFQDMRQKTGVKSTVDLQARNLNKPSITKAELIEWLETIVHLLDTVSLPLLNFASEQKEELDELKNGKKTRKK